MERNLKAALDQQLAFRAEIRDEIARERDLWRMAAQDAVRPVKPARASWSGKLSALLRVHAIEVADAAIGVTSRCDELDNLSQIYPDNTDLAEEANRAAYAIEEHLDQLVNAPFEAAYRALIREPAPDDMALLIKVELIAVKAWPDEFVGCDQMEIVRADIARLGSE